MGLRAVSLTLVIIIFIQVACRHCMPRTSSKSAYNQHFNNFKPIKSNPSPTPFSPSRANKTPNPAFRKKSQYARTLQEPPAKKSMYEAYNFPETEYPLDNSPRDSVYFGMNFKNNQFNMPQKELRNSQYSVINDLKRDIKMKRKLTGNKQMNMENSYLKREMSSATKLVPGPESTRLVELRTFPEVQYPLNAMEIWSPNYWNHLPFTQEEQKFDRVGLPTLNLKTSDNDKKPFTKLTRAKANKFLQSYDKLKEEQRRTSTASSKRSNSENTGLTIVKTATSEKNSDDLITATIVSSIPNDESDATKLLEQITDIISRLESCPDTEYPSESVPIPYKGISTIIEQDTENMCPAYELNNSTELNDLNNGSEIVQTNHKTQPIQAKSLNFDTGSTGSNIMIPECISTDTDKISHQQSMVMNIPVMLPECISTDTDKISHQQSMVTNIPDNTSTNFSSKNYITTTPIDSVSNCIDGSIVESPKPVSDDTLFGFSPNNIPVSTVQEIPESTSIAADPLNAIGPLSLAGLIQDIVPPNVLSHPAIIAPPSNRNTVPGTSIIIIPINNADSKSQPQIIETVGDTPIILYIPASHRDITTKSLANLQYVPLKLVKTTSNDLQCNIPVDGMIEARNSTTNTTYEIAPQFNENPSSTVLVNEISFLTSPSPNAISNTESPSTIYETLPINSMCYNNENSPLKLREEPFFYKSLPDTFSYPICDKKISLNEELADLSPNFERPPYNFIYNDSTMLRDELNHSILFDKLPMSTRDSSLNPLITKIPTDTEFLPKFPTDKGTIPMDTSISPTPLSGNHGKSLPLSIDKTLPTIPLSDTSTESVSLPMDRSISPTPLSGSPTESLALPIDKMFSPTPLSETPIDRPSILDKTLSPTPVSDPPNILVVPIERTVSRTPLSDPTTYYKPLLQDKPHSSTTLSDTTDETVMKIYKTLMSASTSVPSHILSSPLEKTVEPPPFSNPSTNRPLPLHKTPPPTSLLDTSRDSLPLPIDKWLSPTPPSETLTGRPPMQEKTMSHMPISDPPNILAAPIERTVPPTPLTDSPTYYKPLLLDKALSPTTLSDTTDRPLMKIDKTFLPASTSVPSSILSSPLEKTVESPPLSDSSTNRVLPLNKTPPPTSLLDTSRDSLPLPIEKWLSPTLPSETLTGRPPMLDKTISHMLISDPPNILAAPIERTVPPTPLTDSPTYYKPLLLDKALSPTTLLDTTDRPLKKIDKTLMPAPTSVPSNILLSPLEKTVQPTLLSDPSTNKSLPLNKTPPPTSLLDTSNNIPLPIDKTFSPTPFFETPTDRPPIIDKTLSLTPISDLSDIQPSLVEKTIPPTPVSDPLIYYRQLLLDKALSSSPFSDNTDRPLMIIHKNLMPALISDFPNILPSPVEKTVPPTPLSDPPTNRPLLLNKTPPPTPLLDTSTGSLPLPIDTMLTPTPLSETLTDRRPMLHKTLSSTPISNLPSTLASVIERIVPPTPNSDPPTYIPLLLDKAFSPTPLSDTTDRPLVIIDKSLIPAPISDLPNILPLQVEKTVPPKQLLDQRICKLPISVNKMVLATTPSDIDALQRDERIIPVLPADFPSNRLPLAMEKTPQSNSLSDSSPLSKDSNNPLIGQQIETDYNSLPALPNTLLSDIPTGGESFSMDNDDDDLPLSVDPQLIDIPLSDVSTDDQQLSVDDLPLPAYESLPVTQFPELSTHLPLSMNDVPSPVKDLPPIPLSEVHFYNLPPIMDGFPLQEDKVHTNILPSVVPKDGMPTSMDAFPLPVSEVSQDTPLSYIPTNYLPLSINDLPLVVDEALRETPFSVVSTNSLPTSVDLPVSINKAVPDISFTDIRSNDLAFLNNNLPLPAYKDKIFPDVQKADLIKDSLPLSVLKTSADSSDHLPLLIHSALSDNPTLDIVRDKPDNPLIPVDKALAASKLPITKTLLENVLSDITTAGLSLLLDKPTVSSISISPTEVLPRNKMLPDFPPSDSPTDDLSVPMDTNVFNNKPGGLLLPKDKDNPNNSIPLSLHIVPDKPNNLILPADKALAASKLPITKILLENILSDITKAGLSLPVDEPTVSSIMLLESPPSDSPTDDLSLPMDTKIFYSKLGGFLLPKNKTFPDSKLYITKELLENVLSHIYMEGLSSPVEEAILVPEFSKLPTKYLPTDKTPSDDALPEITSVGKPMALDMVVPVSTLSDMTEENLPLPVPVHEILTDTGLFDTLVDNLPISRTVENFLPSSEDKTLSDIPEFDNPTDKLPSPMDMMRPDIANILAGDNENIKNSPIFVNPTDDLPLSTHKKLPPLQITPDNQQSSLSKILPSSKLPITKGLQENILSDMNKGGLSLPGEKTIAFSTLSKLPIKDLLLHKTVPDGLLSDIASDLPIPLDKAFPVSQVSDNLTDDLLIPLDEAPPVYPLFDSPSGDSLPMEKKVPLSIITPDIHQLPQDKRLPDSKLPIIKGLLENTLSEISNGGLTVPVNSKPASSLSKLSTNDLQAGKAISDDLPLSLDRPVPENRLPDIIKDKLLRINPFSTIFTKSMLFLIDTILPDNELSKIPTENLGLTVDDDLPKNPLRFVG